MSLTFENSDSVTKWKVEIFFFFAIFRKQHGVARNCPFFFNFPILVRVDFQTSSYFVNCRNWHRAGFLNTDRFSL